MILQVYIDEETEKRLRKAAEELQRPVEELAEAAVEEAALAYAKGYK